MPLPVAALVARERAGVDAVVVVRVAVGEAVDEHLVDDLVAPVVDVGLERGRPRAPRRSSCTRPPRGPRARRPRPPAPSARGSVSIAAGPIRCSPQLRVSSHHASTRAGTRAGREPISTDEPDGSGAAGASASGPPARSGRRFWNVRQSRSACRSLPSRGAQCAHEQRHGGQRGHDVILPALNTPRTARTLHQQQRRGPRFPGRESGFSRHDTTDAHAIAPRATPSRRRTAGAGPRASPAPSPANPDHVSASPSGRRDIRATFTAPPSHCFTC